MLVLTRKEREVIFIGSDIRVTVLRFPQTGAVKLGIDAPPEVRVLRGELADPPVTEVSFPSDFDGQGRNER